MSAAYHFSLVRSGGWLRLGIAAALGAACGTPMLWALGVFGDGDVAFTRAGVFLFAGAWFGFAVFYCVGWAVRGFVVRHKEPADDAEEGTPRRPPGPPAAAAAAPPRRPPPGK